MFVPYINMYTGEIFTCVQLGKYMNSHDSVGVISGELEVSMLSGGHSQN